MPLIVRERLQLVQKRHGAHFPGLSDVSPTFDLQSRAEGAAETTNHIGKVKVTARGLLVDGQREATTATEESQY